MNSCARIVLVLVVCGLAGCATRARQPAILSTKMKPEILTPGTSGILTAVTHDLFGIIREIKGVVREEPTITLILRDDGLGDDEVANDKNWTLRVDAPFQAPPGTYTVDFTAYDDQGRPIEVKNKDGEVVPLTTSLDVVIKYPEE